jgi:hypothetical protein
LFHRQFFGRGFDVPVFSGLRFEQMSQDASGVVPQFAGTAGQDSCAKISIFAFDGGDPLLIIFNLMDRTLVLFVRKRDTLLEGPLKAALQRAFPATTIPFSPPAYYNTSFLKQ